MDIRSVGIVLACASLGVAVGPLLVLVAQRYTDGPDPRWRVGVVSSVTGAVFAALGWRLVPDMAGRWALPAFLLLAGLGVVLADIDLATHRLPDALTLPAYPAVGVLLAVPCVAKGDWATLGRAGLGGVGCLALYGALCLFAPRDGLGLGDVKLAGVLGLALGWLSWPTLAIGIAAAFGLGGLAGLAFVAIRRGTMRSAIPFGPAMLLGALVSVLVTGWLTGNPAFVPG